MTGTEKTIKNNTPAEAGSPPKQKEPSWLFAVVIITIVAVFGSPVDVECRRFKTGGPVNCTKQTRLLGMIPMPEESVTNVRGAHVASVPGDEYCDPCYRVELETANGDVPLNSAYTSGNRSMSAVAGEINTFSTSKAPGTLELTEPGLLSFENLFCAAAWLLIAIGGSYLWREISRDSAQQVRRNSLEGGHDVTQ